MGHLAGEDMKTGVHSMRRLADRFVAAIETADVAALDAIYTKDAVVWHNYDRLEQARDRNIATIAMFPKLFESFTYADIRRNFFEHGFVQRHVASGIKMDGTAFRVPVCIVATVRGDQIARIDEYFDSRQDARPSAPLADANSNPQRQ
jgi:ketosteroid isomerase-like protein